MATVHVQVTQILLHKAYFPDLVVNLFDAYFLTAEHSTDADFSKVQADTTTLRYHHRAIMKRVLQFWQSFVDTR